MRAFIFPGQGSQAVGMGKEVAEAFRESKEVFQEVDEALKQNLSKIIFEGSMEDLTLTENTQPALMATSIAIFRALEKQSGKKLPTMATFVAGHSLGEYTALAAAGSLTLAAAARLLRTRGTAMQQAVPQGKGAMAALIGVDVATAEKIVKEASASGVCEVANDNADGQVVISGEKAAVEGAETVAKAHGAKRFVLLNVSAPFHSSLMQSAAKTMKAALENAQVSTPAISLVANVTASQTRDPVEIRDLLVRQVTGRVRWRESITYLAAQGVTTTVEVGAGKVLSGLTKRIAEGVGAISIQTPQDIEAFIATL